MCHSGASARVGDSLQTSLELLQSSFPHSSKEDLSDVLEACDGDVNLAFEMLTS